MSLGPAPDPLAISRRMLSGALPSDLRELVDGVLPVGVAVAADHAVTVFLAVGESGVVTHTVTLRRGGAGWELLAAGRGGDGDGERRRVTERLAQWASRTEQAPGWPVGRGPVVAESWGGSLIRSGFWPLSGRYLMHLTVRCAAGIDVLRVDGAPRAVPWHGRVVLAWRVGSRLESVGPRGLSVGNGRRRPEIVGVDVRGARHALAPEPHPRRPAVWRRRGTASYGPLREG